MVAEAQAKNVHFANMQGIIRNCKADDGQNWFTKYCGTDTREGGLGDLLKKTITIKTIGGCGDIIMHSLDSTYTAPEGMMIVLGTVDEPSRADTAASYSDCERLWGVIERNINTRYPKRIGKQVAISYLNTSEYDFTWTLLKRAENELKRFGKTSIFAVNLSTFEVNPFADEKSEETQTIVRNTPELANAAYYGKKGAPREGFYQPHTEAIAACFDEKIDSPVDWEEEHFTLDGTNYLKLNLLKIKGDTKIRCLAFDASETGAAFALKMGYAETIDEMKTDLMIDGKKEMLVISKRPIVDTVLAWQPHDGLRVSFVSVGETLGRLFDAFPNIVSVKSDKWNSSKLIEEVKSRSVRWRNIKNVQTMSSTTIADNVSFSAKMQFRLYMKLRWMVWNNIPRIYKDMRHRINREGVVQTVGEWNLEEHERLLREGMKVVKPPNFYKDFADVDALVINDLVLLELTQAIATSDTNQFRDEKLLALAEEFMKIRQRYRNNGESERKREVLEKIAKEMGLSLEQVRRLKTHVEDIFHERPD